MRIAWQLAAALLLALSPPVSASAAAQSPVAGPGLSVLSAEQKVEPILPADIPMRADVDEQYIQSLATRARDARSWKRFDKELAVLSLGVQRLARQSESPNVPTLPVHRLESLHEHWQLYDREISRWRGNLQRATMQSSEDAAGLATRRAAWQAARAAVTGSAPALLRRVDELIGQIDRTERELSVPLGRLIELGRQGNALSARVLQGSASVLSLVEEQDRRLLVIDSPLLWQLPGVDNALDAGTAGLRTSLEVELAFARDFDIANAKPLRVFAAFSIFLLPVLLWLGRRAAKLKTSASTREYFLDALLRPWSAWLVLVALGYVLFNLQGPLIRQQAVMLLAWIPILRLLPHRLLALVGPWAFLSGLFYFLNVLGSLMEGHQLLYRSFLLTNNLLMLATLGWLLVRARRATQATVLPSSSSVLHALVMLASAVLVAAIGSNILGNVSLATMLTGALLDSSYMALALASGAAVFVSLFQALLSRQVVSQLTETTRHAGPMIKLAANLGRAVLAVGWLVVLLKAFRIYRPLLDLAVAILSHVFKFGALSISLGNVVAFLFATWLSFWLARTIRALLSEDILPALDMQRGISNTVSTLTYYAILFFGLVAALAVAGFRVGQLALAFGALGLGIGLGLQDVVKNFVSGLILMFERPVQPGDVVDVAGMSGTVHQIGMRSTIISTFDGADVVVPNGMLLADKLVNWTLSGTRRRFDINICTSQAAEPRRTIALLVAAAKSIDGVDSQLEPTAILTGLSSGVLEFNLRAWTTADADWSWVRSELALKVCEALAEAGIEIPLPQRELRLRSVSSEAAASLAAAKPVIDT